MSCGFQWRGVCYCFIELDVLLYSYMACFLLELGVGEKMRHNLFTAFVGIASSSLRFLLGFI